MSAHASSRASALASPSSPAAELRRIQAEHPAIFARIAACRGAYHELLPKAPDILSEIATEAARAQREVARG